VLSQQRRFYEENKGELLETYAGRWVCIDDCRVIASSRDYSDLIESMISNGTHYPDSLILKVTTDDGVMHVD
jgi:hypothetical protein